MQERYSKQCLPPYTSHGSAVLTSIVWQGSWKSCWATDMLMQQRIYIKIDPGHLDQDQYIFVLRIPSYCINFTVEISHTLWKDMSAGYFLTLAQVYSKVMSLDFLCTNVPFVVACASQILFRTTSLGPKIDHRRIKYGDKKSLKGKWIYNKKARQDIVLGLYQLS